MGDRLVVVFAHVLFNHSGEVSDGGFDDVQRLVQVLEFKGIAQISDCKSQIVIRNCHEFFKEDVDESVFNLTVWEVQRIDSFWLVKSLNSKITTLVNHRQHVL